MAPLNIQKMMLFLLQRGTKVFNLNIGGVFIASLESAATVKLYYINNIGIYLLVRVNLR